MLNDDDLRDLRPMYVCNKLMEKTYTSKEIIPIASSHTVKIAFEVMEDLTVPTQINPTKKKTPWRWRKWPYIGNAAYLATGGCQNYCSAKRESAKF